MYISRVFWRMQVFSPEENFDDFCKFASIGQGRSVSLAEQKRTHANPFRSVVSGGNYLLYIRALTREICALPISFRKRRLLRKDIGKIWPKSYVLYRKIAAKQRYVIHRRHTDVPNEHDEPIDSILVHEYFVVDIQNIQSLPSNLRIYT